VIDAPVWLALAWWLGRGDAKRETPETPGPRTLPEPKGLVSIAWPRAVGSGGARPLWFTGFKNDVIAWRQSRFAAAKDFLSSDDRSIDAMTKLVEDGTVEHGDFAIDQIALSVVAHWDIECASGAAEYNYNVGGVAALPGQSYFPSTDVQSKKPMAFCAYDDLTQGIADYFGVLSYERYASGLVALLMLPTDPTWFSELGWAGYYGMDPVKAEQVLTERRAMVAVDVVPVE
jgi:hypothetical protein